jgi:hypothetical protein
MIHAQTSRSVTPARVAVAAQVFAAAGFDEGVYQMPEQIDLAAAWILDNLDHLESVLPKYVLGNVGAGLRTKYARRTLMSFIRRLVQFLNGAVLSKRIQFRNAAGKNTSKNMYKIIV